METKKKILLVEDDRVTALATRNLLLEQGYEVITTGDGGEVLGITLDQQPDLILLDLGLESGDPFGGASFDGFGVMEWLKRRGGEQHVPVVVITGRQGPRLREQVLAAGAAAFFQKPIDKEKVLACIRIILDEL